jgi:RHS repeat-associated protein
MALPTGEEGSRGPRPDASQRPAREDNALKPARVFTAKPPDLGLPKAGGAIRSIGEKFTFNAASGTASISIPIAAARARGAPALGLNYDSGSGNGPFGLGWTLDIPAISRRTDNGLPRYGSGDDEDVFVLSGAEDLVPTLREQAGEWVVDEAVEGAYVSRRYRPRIDGLFALIERLTHSNDPADIWWRVRTKDNVLSYYGRYPNADHPDADARITDLDDVTRVFSWLLAETIDSFGNRTVYEYKREDNANAASALHEDRRRVRGQSQLYPKRIKYGNLPGPATPADWVFQLVFDYGEHDWSKPELTEDSGISWPARADAFSRYRAGFEIRTRRLCRRILCFHHLPSLGPDPVLTQSTEFTYDGSQKIAQLLEVRHGGHIRTAAGTYQSQATAPVSFGYSAAVPDHDVHRLDADSTANTPQGLSGGYRFIDLDGEGLAGVLSEHADGWRYKRNEGGGRFGALRAVGGRPTWAALGSGAQIADLENDGEPCLVSYAAPAGSAVRLGDGGWGPFRPFANNANIDMAHPDVRHLDLDGDGKAELVILRDEVIRWRPGLGRDGFGQESRVATGSDEEAGPARIFQNDLEGIFTADMTGDGLADIVRIRNGEVVYWPSLGFGRFGEKVEMDAAPLFDAEDHFSPARLRLADIDGSGVTDILYLGRRATRFWINCAGNRLAAATELPTFPSADNIVDVALFDLLGIGTACLVWSSPLARDAAAPWRYLDLMGGVKPHLLTLVDNGVGAETRLAYRPSTHFYLEDRRRGRSWLTKLPFPVQLLERVEVEDRFSRNRLVSRYAYHHGYFDRPEREFRGFGCVEQWDSEGVAADQSVVFNRPPVLTRTWFHTGAWIDELGHSTQFAAEYYSGNPDWTLPDSRIEPSSGLSAKETREAKRALRGRMLRQEVYACTAPATPDAPPVPGAVPYVVTESRYTVRRLQPIAKGAAHAVFLTTPLETLTHNYERDSSDPRIGHELTLEADDYGQPLLSATVAYPRSTYDPLDLDAVAGQGQLSILLKTSAPINSEANAAQAWRRIGAPSTILAWELAGSAPVAGPFRPAALQAAFLAAGAVDPGQWPVAPGAKRLLSAEVSLYRADADAGALDFAPLDLGAIDARGLPGAGFNLVFTADLLSAASDAFSDAERRAETYVTAADLAQDGYLGGCTAFLAELQAIAPTGWWARDGVAAHDPALFFAVVETRDPWGVTAVIGHDAAGLRPLSVTCAAGTAEENVITAQNDYRILAPWEVTDVNGNRTQAEYDALGRVVRIARMGKTGEIMGDTLASPGTVIAYADHEAAAGRPNHVHMLTRETHYHDLPAADQVKPLLQQGRWREARIYSDGFGREIATKTLARPGQAYFVDGNGVLQSTTANPRWIGSGRTLYDNKGSPVRRWEPYFSTTVDFEEEDDLRLWGVAPELHYDPLGRLVRTDAPDGTYTRIALTAWTRTEWDANDTVADSAWYAARGAPPAIAAAPAAADAFAAWSAAQHAGTPTVHHLDPQGRPVRTDQDNRDANGLYGTSRTLDIAGQERAVSDANGNRALAQDFDLAGRALRARSNDSGERCHLPAADGKPAIVRTGRGHRIAIDYDTLRRPVRTWVTDPSATAARLTAETVYGEAAPTPAANNLRGQAYQSRDQAGLLTCEAYDFKGQLARSSRRLTIDSLTEPDWSAPPALAAESFAVALETDAEGRVLRQQAPDGSETGFDYDEGGLLLRADASLPGASAATPFVSDVVYDAKGRRIRIAYGAGIVTDYGYDPLSGRLVSLSSARAGTVLQDIIYRHDAAGNVIRIADAAQPVLFANNQAIAAVQQFGYDALYRLTRAEGREHPGQNPGSDQHLPPASLPHPADGSAIRPYVETYAYDPVGNIVQMRHAGANSWTRDYSYDYQGSGDSNRLTGTVNGANSPQAAVYGHDAHGNLLGLPHLGSGGLGWDHADRLRQADLNLGHAAFFAYDGGGERVRKTVERGGDREERIYLGAWEIYRRLQNGALTDERTTLHLIDGERRIAMVETETVANGNPVAAPAPVVRYQLGDHLDSARIELSETGAVLSYEELHPYGTTALFTESSGLASPVSRKRYRFLGRERDEETGLGYHAARYYMPWLGRWLSSDPAGLADGAGTYSYGRGNPMSGSDPGGMQTEPVRPLANPPEPTAPEIIYFGKNLPTVEITATFPMTNQEMIDEIYAKRGAMEKSINDDIQSRWKLDRPGPAFIPVKISPYIITKEWAFEIGGGVKLDVGAGAGVKAKLGVVGGSIEGTLINATLLELGGSWNSISGGEGTLDYAGKDGGVTIENGIKGSAGAMGYDLIAAGFGQKFRGKDGSYSDYEPYAYLAPQVSLKKSEYGNEIYPTRIEPGPGGPVKIDTEANVANNHDAKRIQQQKSTDYVLGGDFLGLNVGGGAQAVVGGSVDARIGFREMEIFKTLPRDQLIQQLMLIRSLSSLFPK